MYWWWKRVRRYGFLELHVNSSCVYFELDLYSVRLEGVTQAGFVLVDGRVGEGRVI